MIISSYDTGALHELFGIDMSSIDGLGVGAGWGRVVPGGRSDAHQHDETETFVIVKGSGELVVDGRRQPVYLQNTVVVGAGDVGQLIAAKLIQQPEYGVNVLGFVDAAPRDRREEVAHLPILGAIDDLPSLIESLDVERVRNSHQIRQGRLRLHVPHDFSAARTQSDATKTRLVPATEGVRLEGNIRPA